MIQDIDKYIDVELKKDFDDFYNNSKYYRFTLDETTFKDLGTQTVDIKDKDGEIKKVEVLNGQLAAISMKVINEYEIMIREGVRKKDPLAFQLLLYHEIGHAFYKHMIYSPILFKKLKNWTVDNRSFLLSLEDKMNLKEGEAKKFFTNAFIHQLLNIIMDLQINSTILNLRAIEYLNNKFKIDSVHPAKYGYLSGQSLDYYFASVLSNIENILNPDYSNEDGKGRLNVGNQNNSIELSDEEMDDLIDQLKEMGVLDEDGNLKGSPSSGDTPLDDFDKDDIGDESKERKNEAPDNGENPINKEGGGNRDEEGEEEGDEIEHKQTFKSKGTGTDAILKDNTRNRLRDFDSLFLHLKTKKSHNFKTQRNIWRSYVRGKTETYVSSYRLSRDPAFVEDVKFVVDVSGSMSEESIFGVINELAIRCKKIGMRDVLVVTWNTDFVQEFWLSDFIEMKSRLRIGGGTELYKGINYMRTKNDNNSPIVLITDLEDNIAAINKSFEEIEHKYIVTVSNARESLIKQVSEDIMVLETDFK